MVQECRKLYLEYLTLKCRQRQCWNRRRKNLFAPKCKCAVCKPQRRESSPRHVPSPIRPVLVKTTGIVKYFTFWF